MLNIYKASAGSGKTYTLAREYIRLLLLASLRDERAHSRILAVTFTKKATAEMKMRILKELNTLAKSPKQSNYYKDFIKELSLTEAELQTRASERLIALLEDYTHFAVSTIDGFFQQVVRQFARELALPATYNLTLDTEEVIEQAVDDILFAVHHTQDAQAEDWLKEFAMHNVAQHNAWNPRESMQELAQCLMTEQLQIQLTAIRPLLTDKNLLRTYRKKLEACVATFESAGLKGKRRNSMSEEQLQIVQDAATAEAILSNLNALGTLSDIAEQIRLTNIAENRLPISDINLLLNRVIDGSDTPFVYEKIGTRIQHFMIDEFQDTSILQWANFLPLIRESVDQGRDNLIVGDIKQSIYRFRNSDWHLLEGVHRQIKENAQPEMKTNFRSSGVIVEANNQLFKQYVDYAAEALNSEVGVDNVDYGKTIRSAYSTLHQEPKHKEMPGRYELTFFDTTDKNALQQLSLDAMIEVVRDAVGRDIPTGDIAVLVRSRKEASLVASRLMEEGYEVESAEGLLLASHPAVEMLIMLLSLSLHPGDEMLTARLRLAVASHRYQDQQEALQFAMGDEPLWSEEEQAILSEAEKLPLYEQMQLLIDGLQLTEWERAEAYLTTLLDTVYSYTENGVADVSSFLTYWERNRDRLSIPASASGSAIQVMTIHKSKGLEFRVVIIPFLSWAVTSGSAPRKEFLWVEPKCAPFNMLPIVPVSRNKTLLKTAFSDDYARELRDLYMDNLNLTYVAFTRPKEELYAFGQKAQQNKSGGYSITNIGQLLSTFEKPHPDQPQGEGNVNPDPVLPKKEGDSAESNIENIRAEYRTAPIGDRLRLRAHASLTEDLNLQDFGTLMHDLLAAITLREDADDVLTQYIYNGRVRAQDEMRVRQQLDSFWKLVEDTDWFSGRYQVLSEQEILTESGASYRPDRMMIDGKNVIIIDYKFGEHMRRSYQEQVRNYMLLLAQMGYEPTGYLVYVSLNRIEKV